MYIAWIEANITWGTKNNPTGFRDWEANNDTSGEFEDRGFYERMGIREDEDFTPHRCT